MRSLIGLVAIFVASASILGSDWPTDGGNPQRTNWQKDETILNKSNVTNLKILWKLKLDNTPRQMHSLFPPLIVDQVSTRNGVRQIGLEAGVSDNPYALQSEDSA